MGDFTFSTWGNDNHTFYYYPILKNAHSWGKNFFKSYLGFKQISPIDVNFDDKSSVLIFCRNPISRWFSGASQWFFDVTVNDKLLPDDYKIDEVTLKLIFSAVRLDEHTNTQQYYLRGIPKDKRVYFDCESKNFENNLKDYLKKVQKIDLNNITLPKENAIEENKLKYNIRQQLLEAYNKNIIFQKNVLLYYKHDIVFYHTLLNEKKFYEAEK